MNENNESIWFYVENGVETGPFTDWERGEIDSVRTPRARYEWKLAD